MKTIILSSGKCAWRNCFACGWGKIEAPVDTERLKKQVKIIDISAIDELKVFSSGSFLDDKQFPREFRKWFAEHIRNKELKNVIIESRPEFITDENLSDFKGLKLTVAIGLECADDEVLRKYKKGFTVRDYLKAVKTLRKNGMGVRTYLLVNMPFSNQEKLEKSVDFALKHSDSIVLINTFPHSKSKLFDWWISGKWKPYNAEQFEKVVRKWKGNEKIEFDNQNYYFIPKFPKEKRVLLKGVSEEILKHPYFEVWQDYFQRFYKKPEGKDTLLFIPCSYKKPYTKSKTYKTIYGTLRSIPGTAGLHLVVVSTPGVVPIEFSDYYPLNAYDWPEWEENKEIMEKYVDVIKERVKRYLKTHKYKKYYCFFKYTETYEAVKKACDELGIKVKNLLDKETYGKIKNEKNPIIRKEALESLKKNLR